MDNTLKGYWIFSQIIDVSQTASFSIDFVSQGAIGEETYQCKELRITDVGLNYITSDNLYLVYADVYENKWSSEARRTIQITSDTENAELLAYLQANAVKVLPATAVQNSIGSYVNELVKIKDALFSFFNDCGITLENNKLSVGVISNLDKIITGCFTPLYNDALRKITYKGTSLRPYAFYDYNNATFDFQNLTTIPDYCFSSANYIEVNAPSVKTVNEYAFYDIPNCNSVILPNCLSIGMRAFYACRFTPNAILDVSNVETVGDYAFYNLDIGKTGGYENTPLTFNKNVKFGKYVFAGSANYIKYFSLPECTEIASYMFQNNKSIKLINAPKATIIGDYAFDMSNSNTPENLTSDKLILGNITTIGEHAFSTCTAWDKGDWEYLESAGAAAFSKTAIVNFNAPNMTSAGDSCFSTCTLLETFNAPLTKIEYKLFYECQALKTINTGIIKAIGSYAFYKCTSLPELDFPNCTSIGSEFVAYTNITKIRLGVSTIPANAFKYINGAFDLFLSYDGVVNLANTNAFYSNNQAKMVTVHVKAEYAEAYATASNWSSIKYKCNVVGDYSDYYPE